jgi:hypothetical protein
VSFFDWRIRERIWSSFSKSNGSAPVPGRSKLETTKPSEIVENCHYAGIAAAEDDRAQYFENTPTRMLHSHFGGCSQNRRSAGFPTCCIADFQIGEASNWRAFAGLETCNTPDLEVRATGSPMKYPG